MRKVKNYKSLYFINFYSFFLNINEPFLTNIVIIIEGNK